MKILNKNPYQNIIDFIDITIESNDLKNWLGNLENLPENLRKDHLSKMKRRMVENGESDKLIDIIHSIHNREILSAVNLVVNDVYNSGKKTKRYLKKYSNENFNILVSLLSTS